ncbi:MAG: response regulator [Anaerolineales bacterium]
MTDRESGAVHLQSTIEQAIRSVSSEFGDMPVAIVAEFPAHLPAIDADQDELLLILRELLIRALLTTNRGSLRVQAKVIPAEQLSSESESLLSTREIQNNSNFWALLSVTASQEPQIPAIGNTNEDITMPIASTSLATEELVSMIRTLGGGLGVETDETEFRIFLALPLSAASSSLADLTSLYRAVETRIPEGSQISNSLLVYVEDYAILELLTSELVEAGYGVTAAQGIGDILTLALTEGIDLIILDLQAREPGALDVAMLLKKDRRTQNIPVLFLTATSDPEGRVKMGTANFLVRPEGTGAMLATVRAVLNTELRPTARVLVVEPDDVIRENMIMMLQAHGYAVVEARSAEEALALAERVTIGLVLANASLAQERDYWLIRQLRQLSLEIDVFVLADALSDEDGKRAMSRGASGYSETGKLPDLLDRVKGNHNNV